jgi:8-oxo-dGTP pyrophosphatase MutT (NUDIX family)
MNKTETIKPDKVCPVLLRKKDENLLILAFRHPIAGFQLVKGTIESDESADVAVLRELSEESGIDSANIVRHLGIWESGYENQVWSLYLCEAQGLADEWIHHTQDGGGLDFTFFWQPIDEKSDAGWHPLYREALRYIKNVLMNIRV